MCFGPNSTGPKPTRLSTVATKPRNEPMFSDVDMMGFPGVAPYRRTNEFAITAEGFIPLCEKEYDIIAAQQPYFAKNVPKSAWVYYCVMSLYARLITLKQEEGESTYEEDSFAGQILSGNHNLPAPIEAYIKALGHVIDVSSLRYKLRMPVWPNADGDFGKVGPATHWMYMAMPCPIVCIKRIQEDLRVTGTPGARDWNLPASLRPVEEAAAFKEQWGIDNPNLHSKDDSYNGDTMVIVNSELQEIDRTLEPLDASTPLKEHASNLQPDQELLDKLISLTKTKTLWREGAQEFLTESSDSSPSEADSPTAYASPAEQNLEDDQLASWTTEADTSLTGYITPPDSVSTASLGFGDALAPQDHPTSL